MYDVHIKMRFFFLIHVHVSFDVIFFLVHIFGTKSQPALCMCIIHNTQARSKHTHVRVGQEFSKWPCNNFHVPNGG